MDIPSQFAIDGEEMEQFRIQPGGKAGLLFEYVRDGACLGCVDFSDVAMSQEHFGAAGMEAIHADMCRAAAGIMHQHTPLAAGDAEYCNGELLRILDAESVTALETGAPCCS